VISIVSAEKTEQACARRVWAKPKKANEVRWQGERVRTCEILEASQSRFVLAIGGQLTASFLVGRVFGWLNCR
jgi:hypothetical protein